MARGGRGRGRAKRVEDTTTVSAADSKTFPLPKQVTPQKAKLASKSNVVSPSSFVVNNDKNTNVCLADLIGGVEISELSCESSDGFDFTGYSPCREENKETVAENNEQQIATDENIS